MSQENRSEEPGSTATPKSVTVSIFAILDMGLGWEKIVAIFGMLASLSGATLGLVSVAGWIGGAYFWIGFGLLFASLAAYAFAASNYQYRVDKRKAETVDALEERARNNSSAPELAWDLARTKLESYLDKNLGQVSSIYRLTLVVMLFGMILIGVGVYRAIMDPAALQAAGLAALAGVVVQIIAGTILLIYRSTMAQAKEYVVVLERINAVGMSINVLEGVQNADSLKNEAKVYLSKSLLGMYANGIVSQNVSEES